MRKAYNLRESAAARSGWLGGGVRWHNFNMLFINTLSPLALLRRLLAVLAFSTTCAFAQTPLPPQVLQALAKAGIAPEAMSAIVLPLGSREAHLAFGADAFRQPASTMKLVTTLIALDELGPTYRWKTELLGADKVRKGVLQGPLYLRGGADPDLGWDALRGMLRELRARGVRHWRGDLLLDRSYFTPTRTDIGAPDFDEFPRAYYNVVPDALMLNENFMDFTIEATDKQVAVRTDPPLQGVSIRQKLTLVDVPCERWDDDSLQAQVTRKKQGAVVIVLSGDFPRNCTQTATQNLLERNLQLERFVRTVWAELGGQWQGTAKEAATPATARVLVSRPSRTLAEILPMINKPSNNTMARTLYLSLGELRYSGPSVASSAQKADAVVRAWFARKGIDTAGMVLENGSGLSRLERISPRQLAGMLEAAHATNWYTEFAASLPIAGVDGTMRNRLKGTAAEGRVRSKTGTLNNTSAIAGYVRDVNDREWIVAGMVANPTYAGGVPAINALLQWIAEGASLQSKP